MERLIYTSEASDMLSGDEVFEIVEASARNNAKRDISGFLIFKDGRFLQLIEGETDSLEELMQVLQRDPRHHSIRTVKRTVANQREFDGWRMRRFNSGDAERHVREIADKIGEPEVRDTILPLVEEFLAG